MKVNDKKSKTLKDSEKKLNETENSNTKLKRVKNKKIKNKITKIKKVKKCDKLNELNNNDGTSSNNDTLAKKNIDPNLDEEFSKLKQNKEVQMFTKIESIDASKQKVELSLPHWIKHPHLVGNDLSPNELKKILKGCPGLDAKLVKTLHQQNILTLFPVQEAVISKVIEDNHGLERRFPPQDICVSTPTGSGKTLAYLLAIINSLSQVTFRRLRALVILPVVELAKQVHKEFTTYIKEFNLTIGTAFGLRSFKEEQNVLVKQTRFGDFECGVDILIATPGRLLDHMDNTEGLDFTHLRFLVLDEFDKLVGVADNSSLLRILDHLAQKTSPVDDILLDFPHVSGTQLDRYSKVFSELEQEREIKGSSFLSHAKRSSEMASFVERAIVPISEPPPVPLQKLLFSATLVQKRELLHFIALHRPICVTVNDNKFRVARPSSLTENYIVCNLFEKPLYLYDVILQAMRRKLDKINDADSNEVATKKNGLKRKRNENANSPPKNLFKALVFTSTSENTSKLTFLMQKLANAQFVVGGFTTEILELRRKDKLIASFTKGKTNVLVSTDAAARGMDFGMVDLVVSYDVPKAEPYIHRVGRCARAGRPGQAVTLVTKMELPYVLPLGMLKQQRVNRTIHQLRPLEQRFKQALLELQHQANKRTKRGAKVIPSKKPLK